MRQHHFPTKSASLPGMHFPASLPRASEPHFFKRSLPALRPGMNLPALRPPMIFGALRPVFYKASLPRAASLTSPFFYV